MGAIAQHQVTNFRNFESASIALAPGINLIYGENGSGKTSLLESVYMLASGRSFRTTRVDSLIRHDCPEALITADLQGDIHIGFRKPRHGAHELRIDLEKQSSWERVARLLPVQILDAATFALVEGGPKERRRFLDWGVFHVEHGFLSAWRRASKCIAQRNRLLKSGRPDEDQLRAWDEELISAAIEADRSRSGYFNEFKPIFAEVLRRFSDSIGSELSICYYRGWPEDQELDSVLSKNRDLDLRYGATQFGPHRADLVMTVGNRKAAEVLSRGQQKLVVSALKIAQGTHFEGVSDTKCVYLLDDLPAELDPANRSRVVHELVDQGGQLLLTSVERNALAKSIPEATEIATFHVERGRITA